MSQRVHVIIVNYRSIAFIRACLETLPRRPDVSVTIWDNASLEPEQSALAALAVADPSLKVLLSERNLGFGAAVNRCIEALLLPDEDVVWILNPDTTVAEGAIDQLTHTLNLADTHLILSPVVSTASRLRPEVVWFAGGRVDLRQGETRHYLMGAPLSDLPSGAVSTSFISGAALMSKLSTWRKLGGFREDLFLYWEDADLSVRALHLGVQLVVDHDAHVFHHEGGSSSVDEGKSTVFYYYSMRNRVLVAGGESRRRRIAMVAGSGAVQFLRQLAVIVIRERRHRAAKVRASLLGTWDGIRGRSGPASAGRL